MRRGVILGDIVAEAAGATTMTTSNNASGKPK